MKKILIVFAFILMACVGCDVGKDNTEITTSPSASVTTEPTVNVTIAHKPTASPTVTPEKTAIPMVKDYKLSSDSIILRSGLKISDLEVYFKTTGSELLQKLGNEYEVVGAGAEETWDGYYFKKLGITLVFNDYDYSLEKAPLMFIDCDDTKLELNGLTPDMNFKQIQARIGKGKITKEETQDETQEYEYDLTYKIGKVILIFGSFTKDASDGFWVTIEYSYK